VSLRIDAHQHCWQLSRPECAWPTPEQDALYRDFTPEQWRAQARSAGMNGSVLVQSQPDDRDTEYLLALAGQFDWIRGVVAWVDIKAPDAPQRIRRLATSPKLCGFRPMLQAIEDPGWIADPRVDPAIDEMVAQGLCLDGLVYTGHLPALQWLAERHPRLRIVIDHGAKPPIARGERTQWRQRMHSIAQCPRVFCKLSGLLTEAGAHNRIEDLRPWVEDLLELFGPERMMWGSDWPVLNEQADYAHWVALSEQLLSPLSPQERAAIWGETACKVYCLN